ncbi:hypothetical protein OAI86_06420 [Alphaproteobacteria bacterium]|nr:hypothetical protein [Alphaproteobacteria bacterium]
MSFFNEIKKMTIIQRKQESLLFEYVMDEIEKGIRNNGLWGKALVKCEGLKDTECMETSLNYYIERNSPLIDFFKQHIVVTNLETDIIPINDMCDYANEFSRSLYGAIIQKNTIYKFFKSQGHPPRQKRIISERIRSERIRCYVGLKYLSSSDSVVPF